MKKSKHYLVTEFVCYGDLSKHIFDASISIPLALQINLALSIVRGMNYLHSQGIIHRDLKVISFILKG